MVGEVDRPRRLVLLRHAKAEHGGHDGDALRSLALAGRRQCVRVAAALTERDLVPELVLCSSAVRTRQTWELVRGGLVGADPVVEISDGLYEAGVTELLDRLHGVDDAARVVLVVGHEPTISAVAATLAGKSSEKSAVAHVRVGISTGSFCVLDVVGPWSELARGSALLRAVVSPNA